MIAWEWVVEGGVEEVHGKKLRVMEMFLFLMVVMTSRVSKYVKTYHIVHLKYVCFTIGQLYFNKAIQNKQITFVTQ